MQDVICRYFVINLKRGQIQKPRLGIKDVAVSASEAVLSRNQQKEETLYNKSLLGSERVGIGNNSLKRGHVANHKIHNFWNQAEKLADVKNAVRFDY